MSTDQRVCDVIASALALPEEHRLRVMDAIHASLSDPTIDHGPTDDADEVSACWQAEILRRIDDVVSGRVETITAEQAERMIRDDAEPAV
jgi:hypothetical protein